MFWETEKEEGGVKDGSEVHGLSNQKHSLIQEGVNSLARNIKGEIWVSLVIQSFRNKTQRLPYTDTCDVWDAKSWIPLQSTVITVTHDTYMIMKRHDGLLQTSTFCLTAAIFLQPSAAVTALLVSLLWQDAERCQE